MRINCSTNTSRDFVRSTTLPLLLLKVTYDMQKAIDKKMVKFLLLLNFSKASKFDKFKKTLHAIEFMGTSLKLNIRGLNNFCIFWNCLDKIGVWSQMPNWRVRQIFRTLIRTYKMILIMSHLK